jgi:TRAP-type C4-dicarboxylate transport system substrate-binding protein
MRWLSRSIGIVLVVAVAAAGCASGESGGKAGGDQPPLVLRMGTDDHQGRPASDQIEEFARRVTELSDAAIRIEPVWHAAGDGPDWDQRVARLVVGGDLDMGNIPARAWDTEGVTSLQALNTPFLITTDELAAEVITSSIADEMLAGLDEIGVVGLTLLPEDLRHPFAFDSPLLGPDDYAGASIRTPTSAVTAAVFEALGATVTDDEPNTISQAGMESAYVLAPKGTATGNVTFYPKVNTIVVNAGVYQRLTSEQRAILEEAATQTRTWAIDASVGDTAAAAGFCDTGAAIVLASEADLVALQQATQPVVAWLEQDAATKGFIADIRQMKQASAEAISADARVTCEPGSEAAGTASSELDGIYRFEITEEALRLAGATDPDEIANNIGLWTFELSQGKWCFDQKAPTLDDHQCGTYKIEGDQVTMGPWYDVPALVFQWERTENGDLQLTFREDQFARSVPVLQVTFETPWIFIADVEAAAIPDGVYRAEVSLEDVVAAGASNDDGWTGVWTLEVNGDTYALTCAILEDAARDCGNSGGVSDVLEAGHLVFSGGEVSFIYDADVHAGLTGCCFPIPDYTVSWVIDGEELTFSDLQPQSGAGLEKVLAPWFRIGESDGDQ